MTADDLSPSQWGTLVARIYAGRCVPFLGAAANRREDDKGLPVGKDVAERLVQELMREDELAAAAELLKLTSAKAELLGSYGDLATLGIQNLARVALHFARENDPSRLLELLRVILVEEGREPSPLLATLARLRRKGGLPLRLIVTTNYDRMMEGALGEQRIDYEPVYQPVHGFDGNASLAVGQDEERLILYKIHGSFRDNGADDASRVIITEDDYIEFLTVATRKDEVVGVPPLIESEMVDSTLLFLGYGLEDWDFRTIYKGLIENLRPHDKRVSFAVQRNPPAFWVDFWNKKGVKIVDMDVNAFAQKLVVECAKHERKYGERVYDDS
jgi:hypothetical protein